MRTPPANYRTMNAALKQAGITSAIVMAIESSRATDIWVDDQDMHCWWETDDTSGQQRVTIIAQVSVRLPNLGKLRERLPATRDEYCFDPFAKHFGPVTEPPLRPALKERLQALLRS